MVSDKELEEFKAQAAQKKRINTAVPQRHIDLKHKEDLSNKVQKIN